MPTSDLIQRGANVKVHPFSGSLGELLLKKIQEHGNQVAFVKQVDGVEESLTYPELLRRGKVVAGLLRQHGVGSGDTVMLCCGNTLDFPPIMLGALFVGAALAPINPVFIASDVLHMMKINKPKLFICNAQASSSVQEALTQYNTPVEFIPMEAVNKRLKENPGVEDFYLGKVDDPDTHVAFVMCSSGTTGMPKGVEMTHSDAYYRMCRPLHIPPTTSGQYVTLNNSGPFWGSCLLSTKLTILLGSKAVLLEEHSVVAFLSAIHTYRINLVAVSPLMLVDLANTPPADKYDLSCLSTVSTGGSTASDEILLRVSKHFPGIFSLYGITEMGIVTRHEEGGPLKNVGKPTDGMEIKVTDINTGKAVGANVTGELRLKANTRFQSYRGNPAATAAAFDEDGFFCTGDIGYYDQDGYFFVVDRLKDTYKYNGIFVTSSDIEGVLLQHPEVSEAAVVGIFNEKECAHSTAFVVKCPGATVTEQDLTQLVQKKLPEYKWLHGGAHFVESLPRTSGGKLWKHELRKTYEQQR